MVGTARSARLCPPHGLSLHWITGAFAASDTLAPRGRVWELSMFDNIPKPLTDYLRDASADFDRESFYYFAAAYVSVFYLKKNFTDEKTSDFLNIRTTIRGGVWWGHSGRVIITGETL